MFFLQGEGRIFTHLRNEGWNSSFANTANFTFSAWETGRKKATEW
jgi:hypothetical protein